MTKKSTRPRCDVTPRDVLDRILEVGCVVGCCGVAECETWSHHGIWAVLLASVACWASGYHRGVLRGVVDTLLYRTAVEILEQEELRLAREKGKP